MKFASWQTSKTNPRFSNSFPTQLYCKLDNGRQITENIKLHEFYLRETCPRKNKRTFLGGQVDGEIRTSSCSSAFCIGAKLRADSRNRGPGRDNSKSIPKIRPTHRPTRLYIDGEREKKKKKKGRRGIKKREENILVSRVSRYTVQS